jgi:Phosphotransferase enzyme family
MERPDLEDVERATRALGAVPVAWRTVARGGQTAASRWIATMPDGSTRFVKIAFTLDTAAWIRDEHLFYARHRGLGFTPELLGWDDDGERPVMVLEDLSDALWPPPWGRASVDAVLACLAGVASTPPSPEVPPVGRSQFDRDGWREIASEPEPFLRLGLCEAGWLDDHLTALMHAADRAVLEGDRLLHFDVRSDNICLRDGGAVLIDWNFACIGNPLADVTAWLPSLHAEGGPPPEEVVAPGPEVAALAAMFAGYFAAHAARPPIPEAPHVRPLQLMQARTAIPWASRALGLTEPSP